MTKTDPMPWFPCYPGKWLKAIAGMKPDEALVYWVVCLRIYDAGKPCADTLDALAMRTHLNRRRVSDALDRLFRSGKLVRQGDGIMNPFAEKVLTSQASFRRGRSRAGAAGAASTWGKDKQNQDRGDGKAIGLPLANDGYLDLESKIERKESKGEPAKRRAPRAMIRENWTPTGRDRDYAYGKGFTEKDVGNMTRAFVNHHRSRGTMIADLAATWRTWCDNEVRFRARDGVNPSAQKPTMFDIASGQHERKDG